jgi:hypothetical protein
MTINEEDCESERDEPRSNVFLVPTNPVKCKSYLSTPKSQASQTPHRAVCLSYRSKDRVESSTLNQSSMYIAHAENQ